MQSQFPTKNGETTEIAQFLQNHQSFNIQSLDNKASFAKYTKLSYDGCEVSNLLVAFKIKRECPGRQVLSDSYKRDAIVKKDHAIGLLSISLARWSNQSINQVNQPGCFSF